jgi:hypothetical protein
MPKKTITKLPDRKNAVRKIVVIKWQPWPKPEAGVDYLAPKDGYTPKKWVDYRDGYTPQKGVDYQDWYTPVKWVDYTDGYTPVKGVDYFDGKDGLPWKSIPKEEVKKMVDKVIARKMPKLMADLEWKGFVGVEPANSWYNLVIDWKKHFVPSAVYAPKLRNFIQLGDSPWTYVGWAGKVLAVNATETGIEYVAGGGWAVDSVNWQTGVVVLDTDDISEWTNKYNVNHTGDATGATELTFATVNSNVGSFTNANITVNAKGLITAASNGSGAWDLLYTTVTLTGTQITGMGTTSGISLISGVSGKTICPVSCYAIGVSWTVYTGGTNATWRLNYSATASTTDDAFGSVTIPPATYTASQFFIQLTPQGIASTSLYQNTDIYLTTSFQWGGWHSSNTVIVWIAYYLI